MCLYFRENHTNSRNHQTHSGHRRERCQTQTDHRGHAGVWRRCQQHRMVQNKTTGVEKQHVKQWSFRDIDSFCLFLLQLEVSGRLHRPAVWAVLQGRERPQPQEHPGQSRSLLPLLHLALRSRVRHTCCARVQIRFYSQAPAEDFS